MTSKEIELEELIKILELKKINEFSNEEIIEFKKQCKEFADVKSFKNTIP